MDDITFCMSDCQRTDCLRHPSNIQDRTIPHSYADFKETETCPEFATDINVPINNDTISRQAAIDILDAYQVMVENGEENPYAWARLRMSELPSEQPTLYGYKIEHLAYIARVMEKEGVTAEYAVRTFDDMSRATRMILDEAQQKAEEMLNERFNQQTEGN